MWIAQCLEHDIGAQAATLDDLVPRFFAALNAEYKESLYRHGEPPFAHISPAPERLQRKWDHRAQAVSVDFAAWAAVIDDRVRVQPALVA